MLIAYREISPAERARSHEAEAGLLYDAAEAAMREGRWRRHDFNEYILAVARQHNLLIWPTMLRRIRLEHRNDPSTA